MLREHKLALMTQTDLKQVSTRLTELEQARHRAALQEIESSEKQARLFLDCLQDPAAGEAGTIARAYCKAWAASYGVDLEALKREQKEKEEQQQEVMARLQEG